jgi:hypothetical protein
MIIYFTSPDDYLALMNEGLFVDGWWLLIVSKLGRPQSRRPNTSNSRVWNDHELKFAAQKVLDEQM